MGRLVRHKGASSCRSALSLDGRINIFAKKERQAEVNHSRLGPGQAVDSGVAGVAISESPFPTVKVTEPLAPFVPASALFTTEMVCVEVGQYRKVKSLHTGIPVVAASRK